MEETVVTITQVARLADATLIAELSRCVRADRAVTARLLVHLGEVDARGLYRERAWSSMFAYAVRELHMSDSEAGVRIAAARLGRRFPRVVELLAQGAVHLTAIKLLGPHLTADNHVQVLERARRKTSREIERLVAELAPKPDVPSSMRKLPERASARRDGEPSAPAHALNTACSPLFAESAQPELTASGAAITASATQQQAVTPGTSPLKPHALNSNLNGRVDNTAPSPLFAASARAAAEASSPAMPASATPADSARTQLEGQAHAHFQLAPVPRKLASITPLRPGRYKVEFTVDEAMRGKLEQLQELLRHQVPNGNLAIILERAADVLLEKTRKARFAQTSRPRAVKARASESRARASQPSEPRASFVGAREAMEIAVHARALESNSASAHGAESLPACTSDGSAKLNEAAGVAAGEENSLMTCTGDKSAANQIARMPPGEENSLTACTGDKSAANQIARVAPGEENSPMTCTGDSSAANQTARAAPGERDSRALPRAADSDGHARDRRPNDTTRIEPIRAASRYVPRSVVREVYARDGGQCTFVSPDGRRCHERGFLELHHHGVPYARGGAATADNLRVVCRSHNALYAERDLGRAFMHSKLDARSPKSHGPSEHVLQREQS